MKWLAQTGLSMTVGHWTLCLPLWACLLIELGMAVLVWKVRA